ncbi:50S ribosomal protein L29 [Candidatus Aerophobetes bacterium]|uniref:Large ribosomal subunit protein uL29 n=1 Tax=Aerophobetes bacterium TaxID=2030807 RepID=A0A2A4YNL9_UNCAE|nr:MAG: 50S ribosomal protein L29 [Candidatus Aerophobetes bacterium]
MSTMKDLIGQPEEELRFSFEQLSREIYEIKSELRVSRKLDKPHELKEKKKTRARILTALNKQKAKK